MKKDITQYVRRMFENSGICLDSNIFNLFINAHILYAKRIYKNKKQDDIQISEIADLLANATINKRDLTPQEIEKINIFASTLSANNTTVD